MMTVIFMIVCGLLTLLALADFLSQKTMPDRGQIKSIVAGIGGVVFIIAPTIVGGLLSAANDTTAPGAVGLLCTIVLTLAVCVRMEKA